MQAYRKGIFSRSYVVEDGDDSLELKVSELEERIAPRIAP